MPKRISSAVTPLTAGVGGISKAAVFVGGAAVVAGAVVAVVAGGGEVGATGVADATAAVGATGLVLSMTGCTGRVELDASCGPAVGADVLPAKL
jgi:hypothetical protein